MDVWILRVPPLTRMVGCRGPRIGVCWSRWGGRGCAPSRPLGPTLPALPPSLVLRQLIPHRAEAAFFCLLLLFVSSVTTLEETSLDKVSTRWLLLSRSGGLEGPFESLLVLDPSSSHRSVAAPCSGSSAPPSPPPAHTLKALWLENSDARANKKTNTNTSQDTNTQTKAKTRNCTHPQGSAGQELKCRSLTLCHHQHRHMSDSKRKISSHQHKV